MAHNYDLAEFKEKFEKVKEMGFVKARRSGPTGVGHTLEQLLGMTENNIALPDLGEVELKGKRLNSSSMITLFTFNRKAWKMKPLDAVKTYGSLDKNGRLGLYYTMSPTPNGAGLFLHVESETISVRHISGQILAEWKMEDLTKRFLQKIPAFVLVTAKSEERDGVEWFSYTRAQIVHGTTPNILQEQIAAGNILVDLRLHDQVTRARNHGTAFRVKEKNLSQIFGFVEEI